MKIKSVNVPKQSIESGLRQSKSKIDNFLKEMNQITFTIKDQAKQDKLLALNEEIWQEMQNLVSEYTSRKNGMKNLLDSLL
jgi:hypothetical protein